MLLCPPQRRSRINKSAINNSKGGTVMRVAPVGLLLFLNPKLAFDTGVEASAITHGHPTGCLSGGAFAAIIAELAIGAKLPEAIEVAVKILKRHKNHEETLAAIEKALELASTVNPDKATGETIEKLGQGWVAEEALAISLFASLLYERQFRNGVLLAVNHSETATALVRSPEIYWDGSTAPTEFLIYGFEISKMLTWFVKSEMTYTSIARATVSTMMKDGVKNILGVNE